LRIVFAPQTAAHIIYRLDFLRDDSINRSESRSYRRSLHACSDVCVSNALHVESHRSGCGSLAV